MAFRFKLEPYKRLLNHEKEEAQLEFAVKIARLREAETLLEQVKGELKKALFNRDERLAQGLYTEEYRLWAQRIDYLAAEVERLEEVVTEREIEAEAAKKRLLDIHVQERLVQRLKDKAFSQYQKSEARRHQMELDEMCAIERGPLKGIGSEGHH